MFLLIRDVAGFLLRGSGGSQQELERLPCPSLSGMRMACVPTKGFVLCSVCGRSRRWTLPVWRNVVSEKDKDAVRNALKQMLNTPDDLSLQRSLRVDLVRMDKADVSVNMTLSKPIGK